MKLSKKMWLPFMAMLLVGFLCCCNKGLSVPSDTKIQKDLIDCGYLPSFNIEKVDISKRQTNTEANYDKIYATIIATSDDRTAKYNGDWMITYGLYNDGWALEGVDILTEEYLPLQGRQFSSEELIEALDCLGYHNIKNVSVYDYGENLEQGEIQYSLFAESNHRYANEKLDVTIHFLFDGWQGWSVYNCWREENSCLVEWNLAGDYDGGKLRIETNLPADQVLLSKHGQRQRDHAVYEIANSNFESLATNALYAIQHGEYARHIKENLFKVEIEGDYSSTYPFEYVAYAINRSFAELIDGRCQEFLLIGKDDIGILQHVALDTYNRRVILEFRELQP